MIDTQLHIIDPDRFAYPEISQGYVPGMDETGTLTQLTKVLDQHGVARGVLVQASVYGTDNAAILSAAEASSTRFRVIAMADAETLPAVARHPSVVGIRLNLTDYAVHNDPDAAKRLAAQVFDHDLILQVQADPAALTDLLRDLPAGRVVIDHFGRPDLGSDVDLGALWRLADRDGCYLKASAPFRLAGLDRQTVRDPRLIELVDAFGPDRVLWGSDWPFLNVAGPRPEYGTCLAQSRALIDMDHAQDAARTLFGWPNG